MKKDLRKLKAVVLIAKQRNSEKVYKKGKQMHSSMEEGE